MPLKYPDIMQHNNPDYATVDADYVRGGGRVVADMTALYALTAKVDQLKQRVTKVYVTDQSKYYILKDIANVGNSNGWEIDTAGNTTYTDDNVRSSVLTGVVAANTLTNVVATDTQLTAWGKFMKLFTSIPTTLPASDVFAWAKSPTKPIYTASEVGSDATGTAAGLISSLKDGVSSSGDTLQKLYNLIQGAIEQSVVANITARNAYNVPKLPFSLFVTDDGDGKWAIYQATSTGTGATFVKTSDPDLLNAAMSAAAIKASYESNPDTNAFTNALLAKLNALTQYTDANALAVALTGVTAAGTLANVVATDTQLTAWGKFIKLYSSLKALAFKDTIDYTSSDITNKPTIPAAQQNSDWNASSGITQILNKPTIPTQYADSDVRASTLSGATTAGTLTNVVATDTQLTAWGKFMKLFSSLKALAFKDTIDYTSSDITNKPTIPAAQQNSDWNASSGITQILNKPTIPTQYADSDVRASTLSGATTAGTLTNVVATDTQLTAWGKFMKLFSSLKALAFKDTIDYTSSDITNKPTIPAAQIQSDWNATSGLGVILNKPVMTESGTTAIAVGGVTLGSNLQGKTALEILDTMLYPELNPTLTAPTASLSLSQSGLVEVGTVIGTLNMNATFNRGSISPQYGASSPYRSGALDYFAYTGSNITSSNTSSTPYALSNYTVIVGSQTFNLVAYYLLGVQPLSNKGNNYSTPLAAGNVSASQQTITGVYPVYATTSNITTQTKQSLLTHGSDITVSLVADSGANKQTVRIPQAWGTITVLQQYNTLSGTWDAIDLATFTKTSITVSSVNYWEYVYNGSSIGSRQLKFKL